jgi:hypothetical protein
MHVQFLIVEKKSKGECRLCKCKLLVTYLSNVMQILVDCYPTFWILFFTGLQAWAQLILWLCWSNVDIPYPTKLKSRSAQRWVTQVTAHGVKVFQLSRAAPVNCGDGPKLIQRFTTLCLKYHLPKFCWNWATSILQPIRVTSMGSRCHPQKSKLSERDKTLGYDTWHQG